MGRQEALHLQLDNRQDDHPGVFRRQPLSGRQEMLLVEDRQRLHHVLRLNITTFIELLFHDLYFDKNCLYCL